MVKIIPQSSIMGSSNFAKKLDRLYVNKKSKPECESHLPDMYGQGVSQNMDGKETMSTIYGTIVTTVAIGIIIYCFIHIQEQWSAKTNPNISVSTDYSSTGYTSFNSLQDHFYQRIIMWSQNQMLKIKNWEDYIRLTMVKIERTIVSGKYTEWTETSTPYHQGTFGICNDLIKEISVNGEYDAKTLLEWRDYVMCTKPEIEFKTSASTLSDFSEWWRLEIYFCGSDKFPGCKANVRESHLYDDIDVQIDFVDTNLNLSDIDNPIKYDIRQLRPNLYINQLQTKIIDAFFDEYIIDTDRNYWYGETSSDLKTFRKIDRIFDDSKHRSDSLSDIVPLIQINFRSGNIYHTYERSYQKIVDVLGDLGGIIEIVTTLFSLFYLKYNSVMLEQELLNKSQLYLPKEKVHNNDFRKHYFTFCEQWWRNMYNCCCCCCLCKKKLGAKEKRYNLAREKLDEDMNVFSIIHKMHRYEILERLIIQPYQMKLFPMAFMAQLNDEYLNYDENHADVEAKDQAQSESKLTEEGMTEGQAADTLVEKMNDADKLDSIERKINLWLINTLDLDMSGKQRRGSLIAFNLKKLESTDVSKFVAANSVRDAQDEAIKKIRITGPKILSNQPPLGLSLKQSDNGDAEDKKHSIKSSGMEKVTLVNRKTTIQPDSAKDSLAFDGGQKIENVDKEWELYE